MQPKDWAILWLFFHNYRVSSIGSFLFMLINGYFIFMYFIPEFVLQAQ